VYDLYKFGLAKFMYKYNASMLPSSDNFFQNCTAHTITALDNKFHIFHPQRGRTDYGKKMLQCVGPAAWCVFVIRTKLYH